MRPVGPAGGWSVRPERPDAGLHAHEGRFDCNRPPRTRRLRAVAPARSFAVLCRGIIDESFAPDSTLARRAESYAVLAIEGRAPQPPIEPAVRPPHNARVFVGSSPTSPPWKCSERPARSITEKSGRILRQKRCTRQPSPKKSYSQENGNYDLWWQL